MFGMGWSEMLVVGIVALIVVGPKDLPGMFRTIGEFTGKAKGMAREFNRAMNAAADDAGVKDITKTINAATNPKAFGLDKLKEATDLSSVTKPLSPERAASKARTLDATAKAAQTRKAGDAADAKPPAKAAASGKKPGSAGAPKPKVAAKAKSTSKPKTASKSSAARKPNAAKSKAAKPRAAKPRAASKPTPKVQAKPEVGE